MVLNKYDLMGDTLEDNLSPQDNPIRTMAEEFAKLHGMALVNCSAKTKLGVNLVFETAGITALQRNKKLL